MVKGSNLDMAHFIGYWEESVYTSGHIHPIQPVGGNNPILDFLQGEAQVNAKDQGNANTSKAKVAAILLPMHISILKV